MGAGDEGRDESQDWNGDENAADEVAEYTADNLAESGDDIPEIVRLALDEDDALPWLDSDDDYEDYEKNDTGRIIGFVLLGLVALAAIVGGIWWASHRTSDPALVADGSTIEAPADPYKTAPRDPGGKTFDGTGDSSFAVSEGQTRPARLGENSGAPAAVASTPVASTPVASASATGAKSSISLGATKPAAAAAAAAPVTGGVGVQVGAYSSAAAAEAAWTRLSGQHSALSGLRHRVAEGKADIGTVYRLQAVAADAAAANALCSRLKASGLSCQVKN